MTLSYQKIFKGLFYLLVFTTLFSNSLEINLGVGILVFIGLLITQVNKISNKLLNAIVPLISILIIALVVGLFYTSSLYLYLKDLAYFMKPVLFILLGYLLINKIEHKYFIFNALVVCALISSSIHIINIVAFFIEYPFSINSLRYSAGRDNFIELFALAFILVKSNKSFFSEFILKRIMFIKWIILISCFLYFSRTMFIAFFLMFLALKGYAKLTKRGLIYSVIFTSVVSIFFISIQYVDLDRESKGIEGFMYKLKMAPFEVFMTDSNTNINNHENLWEHWRAFEAAKAIEQINKTKYKSGWFVGKGLSSQVDLGFEVLLANEEFRHIPIIHNGYIYVLYKSGLIGLFLYFVFLFKLYIKCYISTPNDKHKMITNFIAGIALFFFLTSLIITGIYNQNDIIIFILGGLISLHFYYSNLKPYNENSNIRN